MTQGGVLKGALALCALGVSVCLYGVALAIAARASWWMVAGSVLAVFNGCLVTYTIYWQLRGKPTSNTPLQKRVMSLLAWVMILLIFVPVFAPRVWAYLRQ